MKVLISECTYKKLLVERIDFSSFNIQDELCPYIFHQNLKMKEEVAGSLMEIAKDFYAFLQLDWAGDILFDVQLVGSLASYNWSETYSDIDLHIVIPFDKISENKDLLENDFWALKTVYNYEHKLKIKGFEVEVYVQDTEEEVESAGIFSVMRQTWIKKPEKFEPKIDRRKVQNIVGSFEELVKEALSAYRKGDYDEAMNLTNEIQDKFKELRKFGLENGGEYSAQNLAFKAMRRNGLMDKVNNMDKEAFDRSVSIDKTAKERGKENLVKKKKKEDDPQVKRSDKKAPDPDKDGYKDGIEYSINGRRFNSLRDAEKELNIPHSTLNYRVNNDAVKWGGYRKLTSSK
jgi:hypothetical protein